MLGNVFAVTAGYPPRNRVRNPLVSAYSRVDHDHVLAALLLDPDELTAVRVVAG